MTNYKLIFVMLVMLALVGSVTAGAPVSTFTKNQSTGAAPLRIQFNDTSGVVSGTEWLWTWGEEKSTEDYVNYIYWTTTNTTAATRNTTHVFHSPGQYQVTLKVTNASGSSTSAAQTVTVTGFTSASSRAPANSFWRTPMNTLPVHPSSSTWVGNTFNDENSEWVRIDEHAPYSIVDSLTQTQYLTSIDQPESSDNIPYPLPEPGLQDPYPYDYDQSLEVYNKDSGYYYGLYVAERSESGTWSAEIANSYDMTSNIINFSKVRPNTGILRFTYDEVLSGSINHTLQAAVSQTYGQMYPWYASGEGEPGYAPLGAVFRLKASVNVDNLASTCDPACPTVHATMHALQTYGAIITDMHDTEGVVLIKSARDARMGSNMWSPELWQLSELLDPNTDFEFVNTTSLIITTNSLQANVGTTAPVSSFTQDITSGVGSATVHFTSTSTNYPSTFNWTMRNVTGANTTSSFSIIENPTYTFYTGNWSISLNTSNSYGSNLSTVKHFVNVSAATGGGSPPVASFNQSAAAVYPGGCVVFTDTSTGNPTSWFWSEGGIDVEGTSTRTVCAHHAYEPVYVIMTVYNAYGSSHTHGGFEVIQGQVPVTVGFEPLGVLSGGIVYIDSGVPQTIDFIDTSGGGIGGVVAWNWTIQDTAGYHIYNTQDKSYTYTGSNTVVDNSYMVKLTVTDAVGSTGSTTKYVRIRATPVAPIPRFNITNLNTGQIVHAGAGTTTTLNATTNHIIRLTDESYNTPTSRMWTIDYGNGTHAYKYTTPFEYSYTDAPSGLYEIRLAATNDAGTATLELPEIVNMTSSIPPIPVMLAWSTAYPTAIQWNWSNPVISNFDHVMVWKNGVFFENVTTAGTLWTNLIPNTSYTISTKVVSKEGYSSVFGTNTTNTTTSPYWNITSTGTWTCPVGVESINLKMIGGGGGGSGGETILSGSGGSAGMLTSYSQVPVVPGMEYLIGIGSGGANHTGIASTNWFSGSYPGSRTTAFGKIAEGGNGGIRGGYYGAVTQNGTNGFFSSVRYSENGENRSERIGGYGGLGYGAGGGGGVDSGNMMTPGTRGGFGAPGYVAIAVFGYQMGNIPNFIGNPLSSTPGTLVKFTDISTVVETDGIVYTWDFGDGVTSDTIGSTQHVYAYVGSYDVSLNITTVNSTVIEKKNAYIIITNEGTGKINTLYPREVSFTLVDKYGRVIPNLPVTATMTSSSIDNTNWLTSMFGLADTTINSTVLSDVTDDGGQVVFPMISSGRYHLTFYDISRGINEGRDVHPDQEDYIYILSTSATAAVPSSADVINITTWVSPAASTNPTTVYLIANYTDTSYETTSVRFYVMYPNQTPIYSTNSENSTLNVQYPIANTIGAAYVWGMNATSTRFGDQEKFSGITLPGTGRSGLASNLIKPGCIDWRCA